MQKLWFMLTADLGENLASKRTEQSTSQTNNGPLHERRERETIHCARADKTPDMSVMGIHCRWRHVACGLVTLARRANRHRGSDRFQTGGRESAYAICRYGVQRTNSRGGSSVTLDLADKAEIYMPFSRCNG